MARVPQQIDCITTLIMALDSLVRKRQIKEKQKSLILDAVMQAKYKQGYDAAKADNQLNEESKDV